MNLLVCFQRRFKGPVKQHLLLVFHHLLHVFGPFLGFFTPRLVVITRLTDSGELQPVVDCVSVVRIERENSYLLVVSYLVRQVFRARKGVEVHHRGANQQCDKHEVCQHFVPISGVVYRYDGKSCRESDKAEIDGCHRWSLPDMLRIEIDRVLNDSGTY